MVSDFVLLWILFLCLSVCVFLVGFFLLIFFLVVLFSLFACFLKSDKEGRIGGEVGRV